MKRKDVFMSACWQNLVMLSYEIESELLSPFVPEGTEIDLWQGKALLSIVGFQFRRMKVFGIRVPFAQDFSQLNLRFYVRQNLSGKIRRGVVFVKELCPYGFVGTAAKLLFNENYQTASLRCSLERPELIPGESISYHFPCESLDSKLEFAPDGAAQMPQTGTIEHFILERYWGYGHSRLTGKTTEFWIEHPPWNYLPAKAADFTCPTASLYGSPFAEAIGGGPVSGLLALGSPVVVSRRRLLTRVDELRNFSSDTENLGHEKRSGAVSQKKYYDRSRRKTA